MVATGCRERCPSRANTVEKVHTAEDACLGVFPSTPRDRPVSFGECAYLCAAHYAVKRFLIRVNAQKTVLLPTLVFFFKQEKPSLVLSTPLQVITTSEPQNYAASHTPGEHAHCCSPRHSLRPEPPASGTETL